VLVFVVGVAIVLIISLYISAVKVTWYEKLMLRNCRRYASSIVKLICYFVIIHFFTFSFLIDGQSYNNMERAGSRISVSLITMFYEPL